MKEFFRLRIRVWGLLTAVGFLATLGSIAGFFGRYAWWLDLGSHFRMQYLSVFLALAVGYALAKKNKWALAALFMALLNGIPVVAFILPRARSVSSEGSPFRAMLVNVNTERGDASRVISSIEQENPDIVVLEEISDEWVRQLAALIETYPVKIMETREDNFGIGLLSRIPCVSTQIVYIGDAEVPSIIAIAELNGRHLTVIATHPLPPAGPDYSSYRNEQLESLAARIRDIQGPILLLGDLNVTPWSYYYRRFIRMSKLNDSARGRSVAPTWPTFCPFLWIQIDHCLHSDEIAIVARRVGGNTGSDHFPIVVDAAWRN